MWVVKKNVDGYVKYWSDIGWCNLPEDAIQLTDDERQNCTVPIDGTWEKIAVRLTHSKLVKCFDDVNRDEDWDEDTIIAILTGFISIVSPDVVAAFDAYLKKQMKERGGRR